MNGSSREVVPKGLALLSAIGSAASIVALFFVLIQEAARRAQLPVPITLWRIVFAAIGLVAAGAVGLLAFHYCQLVSRSDRSVGGKIIRIAVLIVVGLILEGACLDGILAALYWDWWLSSIRILLGW